MLPYYCVFKNGQSIPAERTEFRLHDTLADFKASPRVFTSLLARRQSEDKPFEVVGFDLHMSRLFVDARAFHLTRESAPEFDVGWIYQQLRSFFLDAKSDLPNELIVRLVVSAEAIELFIDRFVRRWPASDPISLRTFCGIRPFPLHKTTATEVCRRAHAEAEASNAQEGLFLDSDRSIVEGSWSNVFWFDPAGALHTRTDSVLPGVTRELLLRNFPVQFSAPTLEQLHDLAEELFITQSSHGISPVASIDSIVIGKRAPGKFTKKLLAEWPRIEAEHMSTFS